MNRTFLYQLFFLWSMLLAGVEVGAQDGDSYYVQEYEEKVYFSPKYLFKHSTIRLRPVGRVLEWQSKFHPNSPNSLGFQFRYKSISFGVGIPIPKSAAKTEKFGTTKSIDINLKVAQPRTIFELYLKNYKGMVDLNSPNYPMDEQFDKIYYQRPDLNFFYIKGNFIYVLQSKKYSYRAAFTFLERQKQSAGAPLLIGNVSFVRLKADSAIIATPIREAYPQSAGLTQLDVLDSGVGAGYGYTYVYDQFFASAALFLGIDYQNNRYLIDKDLKKKNQVNAVPLLDLRASLGYHSDKYFAGIVATSDYNLIRFEEIKGRFNYFVVALRIGIRFAAPKGLEKLEEKSPFKL